MTNRFEALWTDFLEGELDGKGLAELDALLAGDSALLRRATELYRQHRRLGQIIQPPASGFFVRETLERVRGDGERFVSSVVGKVKNPARAGSSMRPAFVFGLAAGLLLGVTFLLVLSRGRTEVRVLAAEPVGTVVRASAGASLPEGRRLPPGPLTLAGETVMVRLEGGATMILTGPVEATLESGHGATLTRGRATVRCPSGASGFTLRTPESEIVDLGTEFSVFVEPGGGTEVHVLDGSVEWRTPREPDAVERLEAGEALRFDGGKRPKAVPFGATGFRDLADRITRRGGPGGLLAYEGFAYAAGSHPAPSLDGGTGWRHPWRVRRGLEKSQGTDATTDMRIREESLPCPWPLAAPKGGALEFPGGKGTYRIRELASPIDLGADEVTYLSFITREEPRLPERTRNGPFSNIRLTLRSSAGYWEHSISVQMPPTLQPHVEVRGGGRVRSMSMLPAGPPALWVAKVVSSREGMDQVFLRVYGGEETLDDVEPLGWTLESTPFRSDARLDLVVVTGTGRKRRWLDELRIGRSWESVTPRRSRD